MKQDATLVCHGEFVAPHGVRGELRLYPFSDQPEQYLSLKELYLEDKQVLKVTNIKLHKRVYVVSVAGIHDANAAEFYRGKKVYIPRSFLPELPEGEYFQFEIIGLSVFHEISGEVLGTIRSVLSTGANDVYEIEAATGEIFLIPAIKEVVKTINVKAGRMEILPQEEWS